ncbi:MAG: (Fe-S)-binding protein [Gammaproteobacteria bacterium]|nr:(Fe-S)-binding protein [Gammaproteobacteria bacterium]
MSAPSIEKGIEFIKTEIDAPVASFFSACVHCGMCADACLFYTETGDPKYTPINKVEPMRRIWEREYTLVGKLKALLGLSEPVDAKTFEEWETLVYDGCTLCGRCSLVCPVGNDISGMIRKLREGFAAAGHAPEGLIGASTRAVEIGSPMGLKLPALEAQIKHLKNDTGLDAPMDVKGADYMVLLSSMEIMNFPEYLEAIARIMKQAGKTWTLASKAFEATNSGIQIGVSDIARTLVRRVVDAAEELGVKTVISPECGHAFTAIRWDGANLIGRPYKFDVKHILEVLDEFVEQGLIKTEGKEDAKLTYHDPCQIARKGGVVDQPRNLLQQIASNFVEMEDGGAMNWCCGGGGGVSANERADEVKLTAFNKKKSQLQALGVETLVTACANCRLTLEEGLEENEMDIPIVGLTEMLAEYLVDDDKEKQAS